MSNDPKDAVVDLSKLVRNQTPAPAPTPVVPTGSTAKGVIQSNNKQFTLAESASDILVVHSAILTNALWLRASWNDLEAVLNTYLKPLIEHEGCLFRMGIFRDSVRIWGSNGLIFLGKIDVQDKNKPPIWEEIHTLFGFMEDFLNGKVHCSDCGKLIKKKKIAGRFFTGVYCRDCWESKWREQANKETYN